MRNLKIKNLLFIVVLGLFLLVVACGEDSEGSADTPGDTTPDNDTDTEEIEPDEEREPVTITLAAPLWDEMMEGRYGPAADKLDHINIEFVYYDNHVGHLEELFAAEIYPDLFLGNHAPLTELGITYPLDSLIEEHGFDLERIDPSLSSYVRSLHPEEKYIGFPAGTSFWGLFYNKDVFDTLGFEYPDPEVPMTWEETMELARQMSTEYNGTQYYGLTGFITETALNQFAINATDPDTGEVRIETDPAFGRFFSLMETYFNLPGLRGAEDVDFAGNRNVAMHIASNDFLGMAWGFPEDPEVVEHVDIAPVPVWEDMPDTGPAGSAWKLMIADYSEHKDEAFEFLMAYLSDEVQIEASKTMSLQTPLNSPEVLSYYAADNPLYDDKNVDAYFVTQPAIFEERQSRWNEYVDIHHAVHRLNVEELDYNTLLRELAEESEVKIQDAQAAE